MAYEKQTWSTGDTVTAEKLNHIESGISGGGILIIGVKDETNVDATWNQIKAAARAVINLEHEEDGYLEIMYAFLVSLDAGDGQYYATFAFPAISASQVSFDTTRLVASSPDDFMEFDENGN